MVTDSGRGDRGQLILVTAIAIAFIILGVVVVFNGLLYTQTVSSSATSQSATDASTVEHELEEGVQGIVQLTNIGAAEEWSGWEDGVETYSPAFQNAAAESRPVLVSVEPAGTTDSAIHIGDMPPEDLSFPEREIGHFTLTIDEGDDVEDDIEISVGGEENSAIIREEGDDLVLWKDDTEGEPICRIDRDGPITFDFVGGIAPYRSECTAVLIESETTYDGIAFDNAVGTVDLVVEKEEGESAEEVFPESGPVTVDWTVEVEYTYESAEITSTRTTEVTIYGDRQ